MTTIVWVVTTFLFPARWWEEGQEDLAKLIARPCKRLFEWLTGLTGTGKKSDRHISDEDDKSGDCSEAWENQFKIWSKICLWFSSEVEMISVWMFKKKFSYIEQFHKGVQTPHLNVFDWQVMTSQITKLFHSSSIFWCRGRGVGGGVPEIPITTF